MTAWYDFERAFHDGVDKVCSVCSWKGIVQPSVHAENFNVKQRLTSEKSRKLPNEIFANVARTTVSTSKFIY